jgi:uncharacterized protein (TIGR00251 family)
MAITQVKLTVQVQPQAGRNAVVNFTDNVLKIKITAPPVEGKANQELVKYLSKQLGIRKSDILIDKGLTGRRKTVIITGIDSTELQSRISKITSL